MPNYLVAEHVQKIYQVEADSVDQALVKFYVTEYWSHHKEGIKLLREQSSGVYPLVAPPSPMMAQSGQEALVVPDPPVEGEAQVEEELEPGGIK